MGAGDVVDVTLIDVLPVVQSIEQGVWTLVGVVIAAAFTYFALRWWFGG